MAQTTDDLDCIFLASTPKNEAFSKKPLNLATFWLKNGSEGPIFPLYRPHVSLETFLKFNYDSNKPIFMALQAIFTEI